MSDNPDADLESAFTAMNGGTAAQIRNNVSNVANDNPDQAAQYQHLARFTKQPVQTVQNNPDEIKQQAAAQSVDADNIATHSPHTANFLTDPAKAAISHDDIANLVASEKAAKQIGASPFQQAAEGFHDTIARTGRDILNAGGMVAGFIPDTFARLSGAATQQVIDPSQPTPEIPTVAGGAQKLGEALFPLIHPINPTGSQADIAASMTDSAATMVATLPLGGGATAVQTAWRAAYMSAAGLLGPEAQERAQDWAKKTFPNMPFVQEAISQAANLGTMLGTGLGGHIAERTTTALADNVRANLRKTAEANQAAQSLQNLNDVATASKVRARDTNSFQEFMKSASQDAPVKDLYVNAETFAQAAGDKLQPLLEEMPQVKEQFDAASKTGGDLRIPVEDFASKIAGSDMAPNLIQHLKTEPDGFSQLEAESFMQTQGESLKAEVEKVLSEKQGDEAFQQSKQNVEDNIAQQLKAVNRFKPQVNQQYASLISNFFATQAARLGITPEEMAARYPLNIAAQDLGEGFNQPAYHGSPHQFDNFDLSKVGTGEGAQSYGWGQYFAENKKVAETYREKLANRLVGHDSPIGAAATALKANGGRVDLALGDIESNIKAIKEKYDLEKPRYQFLKDRVAHYEKAAELIRKGEVDVNGQLYGVNIPDEEVARMLDWDKPVKEQPEIAAIIKNGLDADLQKSFETNVDSGISGANAYKSWIEGKTDKDRSNWLAQAGIPGIKYLDGNSRQTGEGTRNFVVFDQKLLDSLNPEKFYQDKIGAFNPKSITIGLMNGANLSTFLHESGHFFLHALTDLAGREGAHPEIAEDVAKVMKWFGVKDVAEWNSKSLEEQRPYHEQFARSFESYLLDGKAPSMELQPIFQRFRSWLLNVYKSAKDFVAANPEGGKLDDEVRGVMDRMLASSADIKQAERARGILPLFKTPEEAGMQPDEFKDYQNKDISAAQDAITELDTRRMRDMQWLDNAKNEAIRSLQKEANEKRQAIREDVSKEVMREPVYAAERYIRRGEGPDNETALGNTKLNSNDLRSMGYPDEFIEKMSKGGKYGLTSAKGVHPDALAELLGFSSGHELVNALDHMEPVREKIAALTDQRMLEQHGDLTDPKAIARAADKAIYNEARNKIVATELKALNKQLGNKQILTQAAKQFAAEMVNKENASRLNPNLYMANAARLGKAAEEAFKAGKLQDAALAKRNQLINQYAVKAAFEAQKTMRDVLTLARKLDNNAYREKIPGNYLEQIDSLIDRYDLRQNPRKFFDQSRGEVNLFNWLKAQRDAGFEPAVADWLAVDPRKISYKDMSVEEVKGLGDAVKSMLHMAREAKKVTIAGQQLALDDVVKQLSVPLQERGEKFTKEELLNPPQAHVDSPIKVALYKMGSALRFSVSDLKPQEFKRNAYDLHELEGPFGKYIFEPMFERNYWKLDRLRENSEFFKAMGAKLGTEWQKSLYNLVTNRTLLDPDLSTPGNPVFMKMTRAKLLGLMEHIGNPSNFDKLTRGYNWTGADVMKFIHENATQKDFEAVSARGKLNEKYWPEIEAMSRRLGGVPPQKIELWPVKTKFGTYDGWYAPIDYDPIRSKLSAKYGDVMADPTEQIGKEQNYRATTTFNGSMQNRQANYTDRVNLDFHGWESRMRDTVHDLAYREQLIDANKIISNSKFRSAFTQAYGKEEFKGLGDWLRGIRDMNASDPANKEFEKWMQYSRKGIVMTGIAYRLSTVLKHGGSAALKTLGFLGDGPGMKYFASRAARMATGNAMEDIAGAREKFPEIRTRLMQMDRDYKEGSASMYEKEDWRAKNDRFGHAMVAWSDALTAVPTAWAAYDRAIHEGLPENQGGTGKPMTEAQAVAYANKVVREAHGTALESARSNFLQAKGMKGLFGTIYGFMNNTFGQLADIKDKALATQSNFTNNPAIAARLMGALIAPALMAKWVSGNDKKDPWYLWGAKAIAGEVAGTVPFVREAWSAIEYAKNDLDTVGPLRIIQDVVNSTRDAYGEAHGKSTRLVSDLANAIGELFHIGGLGQAGKSLQYLRDVHSGKQNPQSVMDVVKGVTVGPPPKK